MSRNQPRWAWWVVGILVPAVLTLLSVLLGQRAYSPPQTGSSISTSSKSTQAPNPPSKDSLLYQERPVAEDSEPRSGVLAATSVDRRVESPAPPQKERASHDVAPQILVAGKPRYLREAAVTLLAKFDTLRGIDYATVIVVPNGSEMTRHPIYDSGANFTIATSHGHYKIDVLDLDWSKRQITLIFSKSDQVNDNEIFD